MTEEELYRHPFSIELHKSVPYHVSLEAVISPEGEIEYAMPSHQEYLIAKAMERNGWSRQELMDACPPEFYFDFLNWLIEQSGGYIPVWEMFTVNREITAKQAAALRKLKLAGLFAGKIPRKGKKK